MRGLVSRFAVSSLVITLATPASLAFAGSRDTGDRSKTPPTAPAPDIVITPEVVVATPRESGHDLFGSSQKMRTAIQKALAESTFAQTSALRPPTQGAGSFKSGKRSVGFNAAPAAARKRQTGQMVMGIVTTIVSLAATVYMVRYFQDQQKDDNEGQ